MAVSTPTYEGEVMKKLASFSKGLIKTPIVIVLIILFLSLFINITIGRLNKKTKNKTKPRQIIGNELMVSYDSSNPNRTAREIEKTSLVKDASSPQKIGTLSFGVVKLNKGRNLTQAAKTIRKLKGVKNASPNYARRIQYTPTDEFYETTSWAANAVNLDDAWTQLDNESSLNDTVTIAVLDTGIDTDHEDLKDNLWINTDEIAGNGLDDDNNGYIDDVNGVNFTAMANSGYSSDLIEWVNIIQSETDYIIGGNTPDDYIPGVAQQVTGTGSQISKVSFYLARAGTPSDLTVTIKETLSGPALATGTIKPTDVPTYDWGYGEDEEDEEYVEEDEDWFFWDGIITATATFNQKVTLNKDQKYYLVFETASKNYKNKWALFGSDHAKDDLYAGGDIWLKQANSWMSVKKSDIFFFTDAHDGNVEDNESHGTHVSGIIGARHNTKGITGVAPNAKLMSIKVLDNDGVGSDAQIVSGLKYATDNNAQVINMSLGSTEDNQVLKDAVNEAYKKAVVVAAAGNISWWWNEVNYPAAYDNVLSVGATNAYNRVASFSAYNKYVDISAPGAYIYSSINDGTYDTYSGTSMASPYVAGIAALVRLKHPGWSPAQVNQALKNTARDLGKQTRDDYYGNGIVDALAAINAPDFSSITAKATPPSSKIINYGTEVKIKSSLKAGGWPPLTAMANQGLRYYFLTLDRKGAYVARKIRTSTLTGLNGTTTATMGLPKRSGLYRVYWDGNSTYQRAYVDLEVKVKPVITLETTRKKIKKGKSVKLYGTVKPATADWVRLQYSSKGTPNSKWKTVDYEDVNKRGKFRFYEKPSRTGFYRVRYSGNKNNLYSANSHPVKVVVEEKR